MATPTPTLLTNDIDTVDRTSYTTGSFAITGNQLVLMSVTGAVSAGTVNTPTITGHGATWVLVTSTDKAGDTTRKYFLFRTMLGSDSAAATCSISFGAQTNIRCSWAVMQWANVDTSGTNGSGAIVQSAVNSQAPQAALTVTLSAFANSDNRPYAVFAYLENSNTITPEAGWTELFEQTSATEPITIEGMWKNASDDVTPTGTNAYLGIAVEIKTEPATATTSAAAAGILRVKRTRWG